jgi:hypothetical protein
MSTYVDHEIAATTALGRICAFDENVFLQTLTGKAEFFLQIGVKLLQDG